MALLQRMQKMRWLFVVALCFTAAMGGSEAFAQGQFNAGFSCSAGGTANGKLYVNTKACQITSATFVSGFICQYENILGEVMGKMFCAMQGAIKGPLSAALVIFVTVLGLKLVTGIEPFTPGDLFKNLFKILLIWGFATQADLALGIGYNFFMSLAHGGMDMASKVFAQPGGGGQGAFTELDTQFQASKMMGFVTGDDASAGFFWALMIIIPPLFFIFGYFLINVVKVFARAIFGYTLAVTGITFLWSLMGVFLALSLFFPFVLDKVFQYLGSFGIQLMIVTLFVGMLHVVMGDSQTFITAVQKILLPGEGFDLGVFKLPGIPRICVFTFNAKGDPICQAGQSISIFAFILKTELIFKLVTRLLGLTILTYAMEQFMENVPEIAKQLSGPQYAVRLAGITPAKVAVGQTQLSLPGARVFDATQKGFGDGFLEASGPLPFRLIGGAKGAYTYFRQAMDQPGQFMLGRNLPEADAVNKQGLPQYAPRKGIISSLFQ